MMSAGIIPLESVTFQCPAKVGPGMLTGCSNSTATGNPCKIEFDVEDGVVYITHLPSKKEALIPLSNVAGMVPVKFAAPLHPINPNPKK